MASVGFEPTWRYGQLILSQPCIPFHHEAVIINTDQAVSCSTFYEDSNFNGRALTWSHPNKAKLTLLLLGTVCQFRQLIHCVKDGSPSGVAPGTTWYRRRQRTQPYRPLWRSCISQGQSKWLVGWLLTNISRARSLVFYMINKRLFNMFTLRIVHMQ